MGKMQAKETEIQVKPLLRGTIKLRIIGTTPLFQNRMSEKAKQGLLCGSKKKTAAERVGIKHNPLEEFRGSAEIISGGPTALGLRVIAVKAAMCAASIETEGVTKAGTQRLLFLPGEHTALYGTPQLRMDIVRSADMNRTPDVRTRAYLPQWATEVEIGYISPQLSPASVIALLCNAGVLIGVGDFRQEKGKGAFGSFRVIGPGEKDAEWDDLVKNHGRKAQERALESPEYANQDTHDLMEHHKKETSQRAISPINQDSAIKPENGRKARMAA